MNERGLISSLFDLSFSHFITPKIQRFLYALLLIFSGIGAVGVLFVVLGLGEGVFAKIGALLIGLPAAALCFLLLAMYFRVMMEILIVVFRGVEYLRDIDATLKAGSGGRSS
jgi:hypothetical protein